MPLMTLPTPIGVLKSPRPIEESNLVKTISDQFTILRLPPKYPQVTGTYCVPL